MAQYQSFPGAPGASQTLDKVKALLLPDLAGRSFLDVGCNEGFVCGFAKFLGASRSVGLDKSALFLDRARVRFPDCEFLLQDWTELPEGRFDVILLASALHYAEDQPALIARLVDKLSDDGTLVLEMGIASSAGSEWVEVDRGIDRRLFPSMAKLREILAGYAWKWMGRSVSQAGDPVSRHVVHVSRRRPVAYLLMQPPGYGKSSLASQLFVPAGVPVVSGDEVLGSIAHGRVDVSPALKEVIARSYSPFRIDAVIRETFEQGGGPELVELWIAAAGDGDFALDMFVPVEHQEVLESNLRQRGYFPVRLLWERVGPPLLPSQAVSDHVERFYESMPEVELPRDAAGVPAGTRDLGYVDELGFSDGKLSIRGWAVDESGELPAGLTMRCNGADLSLEKVERQQRLDVQRHLQLSHGWVGFRVSQEIAGLSRIEDVPRDFLVFVPGKGRVRLSGRVQKMLASSATGHR